MIMQPLVNLRFTHNYGPYVPGQVAHFPSAVAQAIVTTGAAERLPDQDQRHVPLPPRRGTKKITTK